MQQPKSVYRFRQRIPLLNGGVPQTRSAFRSAFTKLNEQLNRFAFLKPQRRMNAPWMDNFAQLGRNIRLCEECNRKYRGWHKGFDYVYVRDGRGDCTSCGEQMRWVHCWWHWTTYKETVERREL